MYKMREHIEKTIFTLNIYIKCTDAETAASQECISLSFEKNGSHQQTALNCWGVDSIVL